MVGIAHYVLRTLANKVVPNRASWALWALITGIAFSAQVFEGVGIQTLMTLMVCVGPAVIFAVSLFNRESYWEFYTIDRVCLALSVAAIVMWLSTDSGRVAIIFCIVADALAALPTMSKIISDPNSETPLVYATAAFSAAVTLLTLQKWTFVAGAFPLYIAILCTMLSLLILSCRAIRSRAAWESK